MCVRLVTSSRQMRAGAFEIGNEFAAEVVRGRFCSSGTEDRIVSSCSLEEDMIVGYSKVH